MKKITTILLLLITVLVSAQDWQYDMEKAQKRAKAENKKIILVFSGSDWCAPCIKLEREIWNTEEFNTYAKDHYILVRADFPRKKKNKLAKEQQEKNNKLFEQYNPESYFPYVLVLDDTGKVLGTTAYEKLPIKEYIKILDSF